MGMSNMWRWAKTEQPQTFPEDAVGPAAGDEGFPLSPNRGKAEWFWEGGFFKDPINDLEYIRDWNLRAVLRRLQRHEERRRQGQARQRQAGVARLHRRQPRIAPAARRRGPHAETTSSARRITPTAASPAPGSIDLHEPKEQYAKKFPEDPFISKAIFDKRVDKKYGYPDPLPLLLLAEHRQPVHGRPQHQRQPRALGTIRVMRTCGMMGEVVGKAAYVCDLAKLQAARCGRPLLARNG